jgi:hypothetical protein
LILVGRFEVKRTCSLCIAFVAVVVMALTAGGDSEKGFVLG